MEIIQIADIIGTAVFAISGFLSAANKKFDLFGILFIGAITALGGGTFRDFSIGALPVGWLQNPEYIAIILIAFVVTLLFKKQLMWLKKTLMLFDTIGIATFTIIGLEKAIAFGINPFAATIMGLFTAIIGGVIRDVLCNDIPIVFQKEIYATACLAGAFTYTILIYFNIDINVTTLIAMGTIIGIRLISVYKNLSLPKINIER